MSLAGFLVPALAADSPLPLDPGVIALCIPIVAIIFGSLTAIVKTVVRHRERMAKIGMGIDPDADPTASSRPSGRP